ERLAAGRALHPEGLCGTGGAHGGRTAGGAAADRRRRAAARRDHAAAAGPADPGRSGAPVVPLDRGGRRGPGPHRRLRRARGRTAARRQPHLLAGRPAARGGPPGPHAGQGRDTAL
ncbi:LOW QUALITY PROTEIN: 1-acylglycerol-3-phosphate O-acyltransferase, partial [Streptomyces griseoflavus Tu4000]